MESTVRKSHGNIHVNVLPLVNRGMKASAVNNGLGQGKAVQHDMDITGIGGTVNLPGHVKRVVIPTSVRHDHVDDQLVYRIFRTGLPENQKVGRQGGGTVGNNPKGTVTGSDVSSLRPTSIPPDIPVRAPETPSGEIYFRLDTFVIVTR